MSSRKLSSLIKVTLSGTVVCAGLSLYNSNEKFHRDVVMPLVHLLIDPERAHRMAVLAAKYRLFSAGKGRDPPELNVTFFGRSLPNPVGIAAGFDKNCEGVLGLRDMGFGFVEIGSVTPQPQPGNEKPRVFRLKDDLAVINRYGFNSDGHKEVLERLESVRKTKEGEEIFIGINLGKNKESEDPINDYVEGIKTFGQLADYVVINISSPNTPGLRSMQTKRILEHLLKAVIKARDNVAPNKKLPLLLKLAPDLTHDERRDICDLIKKEECRVDGLIISNTTIQRSESLKSSHSHESGGLSGKPLKALSTEMIAEMYRLTNGNVLIIGVGGISSADDAYEKIKAGASLVQLYTALVYEGPPVVRKIKRELAVLLQRDGYKSLSEAVGSGGSSHAANQSVP